MSSPVHWFVYRLVVWPQDDTETTEQIYMKLGGMGQERTHSILSRTVVDKGADPGIIFINFFNLTR